MQNFDIYIYIYITHINKQKTERCSYFKININTIEVKVQQ